ncbi:MULTISPECIES: HrcA family transcriptional regulator [Aphanothece]|uniref:HrcA family transcriptional regulator n=1 Tax=Aphanothece TaxID=1121 RepID=UPI0039853236
MAQNLSQRQQEVLQLAVRHYVDTVEPVGSKTLVRRFGLPASSATVRSAMGALEQRGLLTQPHTSAGRIPSQQGYRVYVDRLLPAPGAAAQQLERELTGLSLHWSALDDLLLHLSRRLGDFTGLLSLITRPQKRQQRLQELRLVASGDRLLVFLVAGSAGAGSLNLRRPPVAPQEIERLERWTNHQLRAHPDHPIPWQQLPQELRHGGDLLRQALERRQPLAQENLQAVASGLGGLLAQPEFSQTASLRPLLQLVEDTPQQVLGPRADAIWIGREHPHGALERCAVVQASYTTGDGAQGQVALVGPMRMAYATARAAVHSVAATLSRLLS